MTLFLGITIYLEFNFYFIFSFSYMISITPNGSKSEHRLVNGNEVSFFWVFNNKKNNSNSNNNSVRVVSYLSL